jgi:hypothetical protein
MVTRPSDAINGSAAALLVYSLRRAIVVAAAKSKTSS